MTIKLGMQLQLGRLMLSDYNPLNNSSLKAATIQRIFTATGKHFKLRQRAASSETAYTQDNSNDGQDPLNEAPPISSKSANPSDSMAEVGNVRPHPTRGVRAFRSYAKIAVLPKKVPSKCLRSVAKEMKH